MLKRQVWKTDDDEFEDMVKNSQRVLKLNAQYENHPYTKKFTKARSVVCVRNIICRGGGRCKIFFG